MKITKAQLFSAIQPDCDRRRRITAFIEADGREEWEDKEVFEKWEAAGAFVGDVPSLVKSLGACQVCFFGPTPLNMDLDYVRALVADGIFEAKIKAATHEVPA